MPPWSVWSTPKFPELGELLLHRVIAQFKKAYKRNDKPICIAAAKFLAHLINQGVLHEVRVGAIGKVVFCLMIDWWWWWWLVVGGSCGQAGSVTSCGCAKGMESPLSHQQQPECEAIVRLNGESEGCRDNQGLITQHSWAYVG